MFPDFGKAGMPYAKSVRSVKALHGAKPDPGLLFDCKTLVTIAINLTKRLTFQSAIEATG